MDFKVIFKKTFLEDLESLVKRIAIQDEISARSVGDLVIGACERLHFFPERHPRVRQRPGVRRVIIKEKYKVFYRIRYESKLVEVLRLWDGRRDTTPRVEQNAD